MCAALMEIAYLTAQRRGDPLRLPLTAITPTGIQFTQGKGGEMVLVRRTPRLRTAVDTIKAVRKVVKISTYLVCKPPGQAVH
jgi:hypothetical protein